MVRVSVRELDESQKVLCRLNLQEISTCDETRESMLLSSNDDKINLLHAKTEVYELLHTAEGQSYQMRCIHRQEGLSDGSIDWYIPISVLIPHFEIAFFKERVFHIELDGNKFIELTGEEILKLSNQLTLTRSLQNIDQKEE